MKKMTNIEKVLNILADNNEHHYTDLAKKLKVTPATVAFVLSSLKQQGLVETPSIVIKIIKKKSGVFKLIAKKSNKYNEQ